MSTHHVLDFMQRQYSRKIDYSNNTDSTIKKGPANNISYRNVLGWRLSDFRIGEPLVSSTWTEFHR